MGVYTVALILFSAYIQYRGEGYRNIVIALFLINGYKAHKVYSVNIIAYLLQNLFFNIKVKIPH
jgi:hypothetical protein